jgi:hypothetical protein
MGEGKKKRKANQLHFASSLFLALPTKKARILCFRFIIEYSSLRDFYRPLGGNNNNNNRSIFI